MVRCHAAITQPCSHVTQTRTNMYTCPLTCSHARVCTMHNYDIHMHMHTPTHTCMHQTLAQCTMHACLWVHTRGHVRARTHTHSHTHIHAHTHTGALQGKVGRMRGYEDISRGTSPAASQLSAGRQHRVAAQALGKAPISDAWII